jgi:hypothetical protein
MQKYSGGTALSHLGLVLEGEARWIIGRKLPPHYRLHFLDLSLISCIKCQPVTWRAAAAATRYQVQRRLFVDPSIGLPLGVESGGLLECFDR